MKLYKKLGDYLGAPVGREGIIPQNFLEELLRDIADEPPLPFHERLIYDLSCNRDVFHELGFPLGALMRFAEKTQLLPREILGINSLPIVLTHDPCMQKLRYHINTQLNGNEKAHAKETMMRCAQARYAVENVLSQTFPLGENFKKPTSEKLLIAIHYQVCSALKLPTD